MKYNFLLIKIIFFIFFLFNIFTNIVQASNNAFIVMKINNEIITNININEEYRYLIALNTDLKSLKKKEIFNLAKNSFLREKIKENELKKYFKLNQSSKYIDQTLKNLYVSLKISSEIEFKKYLSVYNLTIEDVKKKIEVEVLWNELIYEKFHKQIDIDEEKIKKKINVNKIQKNYLLSEIFFSGENKEKINEKYNLIKKSISEIGFKNTANIYSLTESAKIGGSIGWIGENQLTKKVVNEINKLQIGEFTKPIDIPGGVIILKLDEKEDKKITLDFDSEFKKLIEYDRNRQLNQFSAIYFNKLKFNTKIEQ
ncbi:MAG: peptidylprolyl isomerase [Pelagibacterales bacterium]|nr:peptidylprolyl isomerase [Pelagibacterales bacterium]